MAHTYGIHAKLITCETVHLREIAGVEGSKVEKVLLAFPHWS